MKLITKMTLFGTTLVAMMLLVVGLSYTNLRQVSQALTSIGNQDIPLDNATSAITAGQLRQSVWLERAMLAGEIQLTAQVDKANEEFEKDHNSILHAISTANTILNQASDGNKAMAAFQKQLGEIRTEYDQYHESGAKLFTALQANNIVNAEKALKDVQHRSETLSAMIDKLNSQVSINATRSANDSIASSTSTVVFMGIIGIIVILFSIGLSVLITRSVLIQLGADPAELRQIAEHLQRGRLQIEARADATGVAASISRTIQKLQEVISGIQYGAEEVSLASAQVGQGNADLSQRTQEQASSLEEVAASMEEMTSTVNQNAENADQANQLASEATEKATQGGDIANRAVQAMGEISESSRKIAEIINVIDDISFQINLLALNAAVEAARAGDQGRGFAVVAGEVRNLAGRSATAAKEIKELIQDSVGKVEAGTQLVGESGTRLTDIVNSIKQVSENIAEIAAASREQSDGITQVNRAILQMDDMTQQNASLVEEAAAASETVDSQAQELKRLVAFFKLGDDERQPFRKDRKTQETNDNFAAKLASRLSTPLKNQRPQSDSQDQLAVEGNWEEF